MCERYAKTQLMSGVTTIRTMGGVLDVDSQIRDRIDQGTVSYTHLDVYKRQILISVSCSRNFWIRT